MVEPITTAALIGAGSSIISGLGSFFGTKSTNKTNQAIAQKQMDFQERMSSTAYQRSMTDMRKAGLNPILAYKTGGASSPGGAGIPALNAAGPAIATALQTRRLAADLKNVEAETVVKQQEGRIKKQEAIMAEGYGTSILGRNVGSAGRIWDTILEAIGLGGNSAKSAKPGSSVLDNSRKGPLKVDINRPENWKEWRKKNLKR